MGGRYTVLLVALGALFACIRTTDPSLDGSVTRDTGVEVGLIIDTGGVADAPSQGSGADASCGTECLRAVICCRSDCTGPAVNRGCCSCGPGEIDSLSCSPQRTCVQGP